MTDTDEDQTNELDAQSEQNMSDTDEILEYKNIPLSQKSDEEVLLEINELLTKVRKIVNKVNNSSILTDMVFKKLRIEKKKENGFLIDFHVRYVR